jgi:hypothetical protein
VEWLDKDVHRAAARHAGTEDLVIEVEIDDGGLTAIEAFQRRLADVPSAHPPTEPAAMRPFRPIAAFEPVLAETDPCVSITVATAKGSRRSRSAVIVSSTSCDSIGAGVATSHIYLPLPLHGHFIRLPLAIPSLIGTDLR